MVCPCKRLTEAEVTALTILSNFFIQLWLTGTFRLFFIQLGVMSSLFLWYRQWASKAWTRVEETGNVCMYSAARHAAKESYGFLTVKPL